MTAPPDRIWIENNGRISRTEPEACLRQWHHEYILRDGPTMQAAIAAAGTEGLRGALACIDAQIEPLDHLKASARKHNDTRDGLVHGYAADQLRHVRRAILALIPAPPPADGSDILNLRYCTEKNDLREMFKIGDVLQVYVNEGDLAVMVASGIAVKVQRPADGGDT